MSKVIAVLISCLFVNSAWSVFKTDLVRVYKKDRLMAFFYQGQLVRSYRIKLSIAYNDPRFEAGPKRLRGDKQTPEGYYKVISKPTNTNFKKSLYINYPNKQDIAWGKENGHSYYRLGDAIQVHGFRTKPSPAVLKWAAKIGISKETADEWAKKYFYPYFDWTDGCMAVTDEEMDEIFESVKIGTPFEIYPGLEDLSLAHKAKYNSDLKYKE